MKPTGSVQSRITGIDLEAPAFAEAVLDTAQVIMLLLDTNGRIVRYNRYIEELSGYSLEEVQGKDWFKTFLPEQDQRVVRELFDRAINDSPTKANVNPILAKDGLELEIEWYDKVLKDSKGEIRGLLSIGMDISKRMWAEERYRVLFESSRDAIMTLAPPSWRFTSGNTATVKMFGARDEAHFVSLGPWHLSPEKQSDGRPSGDKAKEMIQTAMHKGVHFFEWTHRKIDGKDFPATVLLTRMEINGQPLLQGTVRDISEQKTLEMQLVQAQKLESIGQLAAGIAHEINTPAQYAGDNISFLKESFKELQGLIEAYDGVYKAAREGSVSVTALNDLAGKIREADLEFLMEEIPLAIEQSIDGITRISDIVRAMKEFSHPGIEQKVFADVNQGLKTTISVSRNEWKYAAEMETDLDLDLPLVPCLPGELNQVFLNIIVNAAHAIEDHKEKTGRSDMGKIVVSTRLIDGFAEIRIQNSGSGITEEIQSKLFDPFFTTKEVGKGTGQGLAISRSTIVDKHGGKIWFETHVDKGTTFFIRLPLEEPSGGNSNS